MKKRRSSLSTLENKAQQFKFVEEIPYDATCYSLGINPKLACPTCISKIEHGLNLTKKGKGNKTKFRRMNKRNRCEQRWLEEYVSGIYATNGRFDAHVKICKELGIQSCIQLKSNKVVHTRRKESPLTNKHSSPPVHKRSKIIDNNTLTKSSKINNYTNKQIKAYEFTQMASAVNYLLSLKLQPSESSATMFPSEMVTMNPSEMNNHPHHLDHIHLEPIDLHHLVDPPFLQSSPTNPPQPNSNSPSFETLLQKHFPRKASILNNTPWTNLDSPNHSKSSQNSQIHLIISLLRVLSSDNLQYATDILNLTLNSLKQNKKDKVNDMIVHNIKNFMTSNLSQPSTHVRDAKFAIAAASIGSNDLYFHDIRN